MAPETARNLAACCADMRQAFIEQPTLRLTRPQAQRLWHLGLRTCERALGMLIAEGFLIQTADDQFCRPDSMVCGDAGTRTP